MFKGKAMTYYGRWSYKYEIAAQKGADRRDHRPRDDPGGLSLDVVENSNSKENFVIDSADKNMDTVAVRSWITLETAQKLFSAAGQNFDDLKESRAQQGFSPRLVRRDCGLRDPEQDSPVQVA